VQSRAEDKMALQKRLCAGEDFERLFLRWVHAPTLRLRGKKTKTFLQCAGFGLV